MQFDALVNGAVEDQLRALKEFILDENERLTAEAIEEFRQDSLNIWYNSVYLEIQEATNTVKSQLTTNTSNDPNNKVITALVVEDVRRDLDEAMSNILKSLKKARV